MAIISRHEVYPGESSRKMYSPLWLIIYFILPLYGNIIYKKFLLNVNEDFA